METNNQQQYLGSCFTNQQNIHKSPQMNNSEQQFSYSNQVCDHRQTLGCQQSHHYPLQVPTIDSTAPIDAPFDQHQDQHNQWIQPDKCQTDTRYAASYSTQEPNHGYYHNENQHHGSRFFYSSNPTLPEYNYTGLYGQTNFTPPTSALGSVPNQAAPYDVPFQHTYDSYNGYYATGCSLSGAGEQQQADVTRATLTYDPEANQQQHLSLSREFYDTGNVEPQATASYDTNFQGAAAAAALPPAAPVRGVNCDKSPVSSNQFSATSTGLLDTASEYQPSVDASDSWPTATLRSQAPNSPPSVATAKRRHNSQQQQQQQSKLKSQNQSSKVNSKSVSSANGQQKSSKSNQCPVCSRNYARPSTLKTHLRTHTNERPFKCNVCLKTFSQAANLTAHQRVHTGERPFSCPICARKFSQSSSVITHLRTHSGERPYRCSLCSRTFSDSSTLTKHCRIHSGEKPYQCDYCPLNFSQSGNLSRHLKLHLIGVISATGGGCGADGSGGRSSSPSPSLNCRLTASIGNGNGASHSLSDALGESASSGAEKSEVNHQTSNDLI